MTSHADPVYEARYGHTPKNIFSIGYCSVVGAFILLTPAPAWAKVIVVGVFGGIAVMLAAMAFSHNPALRVDAAGVTTRPYPLRFSVIAFYPWEDVTQILILRSKNSKASYVQIQLHDGAAWTGIGPTTPPRARRALIFTGGPGVAVNGWTLHPARLAAVVARCAPGVQVIDEATGSVVNPAQA